MNLCDFSLTTTGTQTELSDKGLTCIPVPHKVHALKRLWGPRWRCRLSNIMANFNKGLYRLSRVS